MTTDIFDEEVPDGDTPDNFLNDLMAEFGDGTKPAKSRTKPSMNSVAYPPAPRWTPYAIALRTIVQRCGSCGEEHTYTQGVYLEAHATGSTAIRYTPFTAADRTPAILALPRRKDITFEQVAECATCFGVEERLMAAFAGEPSAQLSLNLGA